MFRATNLSFRLASLGLIILSFSLCAFLIIVDAGIGNTPYETSDTLGRKMGFNDPLSPEHYRIIISNFRMGTLLTPVYAYAWILLSMHVLGGWFVWHLERVTSRGFRWFFGLQGLLFPMGWFGFLSLPLTVLFVAQGKLDREGIIDVPFITLTAQPIWIATAMAILAASWIGAARPGVRT